MQVPKETASGLRPTPLTWLRRRSQLRPTASRSTAAAKRSSRENMETFASMAASASGMADSSRRRTPALIVKELTDALVATCSAGCITAVVRLLEVHRMDAVNDYGSKRPRMKGAHEQESSGVGLSMDTSGETDDGDADDRHTSEAFSVVHRCEKRWMN